MTGNTTAVSVLGLGAMGTALANTLLANGHQVTVWNRSPEKAAPLVAAGAAHASSPERAIAPSELVIVCILDYADVRALTESAPEAWRGRTVVNLTNGSPSEARALAEHVSALGARYLDGGIMAVPSMIGGPDAVVLYSGSSAAFDAARGALETFGRAVYLGEDPGTAPLQDLALLTGMYGMFGGFLHAAALVRSAGEDVEAFTTSLLVPWLHAMTGSLPAMSAQIASGDYSATGSNLAMQVSQDSIGDLSRAQGVSTELSAPLFELMRRRVADGHGDEDVASVVELLLK